VSTLLSQYPQRESDKHALGWKKRKQNITHVIGTVASCSLC